MSFADSGALVLISGGICFPETSTSIFNVSTNVSAASTYGDLTYEISNGEVTITSCDENATEIEIPSEIEGYSVTAIGEYAFADCSSLTSVTISDSITTIKNHAFLNCTALTSTIIPNSITYIGDNAFESCNRLTSITIPDSVKTIGNYVFSGCTELTSIKVDENNLSYSDIDGILFNKDKTLLMTYPNLKSNINQSYIIPNSVITIGVGAFYFCDGLTSVIIPNSVTNIGDSAFNYCSGLTSVTIPNSVTNIGDSAFNYCYRLTSVTIPDSVTTIGNSAFGYCTTLTSITIPNSVTTIGSYAFARCFSLTSITVDESNSSYSDIDGILFNKEETILIAYPCSKELDDETYTIPNTVNEILPIAFDSSSKLTSVIIPRSVKLIGYRSLGYTFFNGIIDDFKIYGYLNSAAESYAKTNEFEFIDIESKPIVTTPTPSIVYGDISMDNKIDNVDLVTLCQVLIKEIALDNNQSLRADLNNDGAIDVSDAATLKQYILGDKVTLGPKK